LLTSGKRNLLVTAVPAAVSDLAEFCEIVSKTVDKCLEVEYYVKALPKISRLESSVLGNARHFINISENISENFARLMYRLRCGNILKGYIDGVVFVVRY
jgi:hypothetical protein